MRLTGSGTGQAVPQPPPPARPPSPGTQQLPPLPVTQIDPGAAAATLDSPRRLTLQFAEPRPIDEVLRLLVEGTPFSLAIDPDVSGSFRGELKMLTLREALTTLLTPLGLEFTVEGTVIHVTHRRTGTRQFDLNVLNVRRGLQRTTGAAASEASPAFAEASAGQGGTAVVTTTVVPEDVFTSIGEGVKALLSPQGRMHIDRRAGLATVTDFPEQLDRVALYLETLHVRSSRQIRIEAQVFEVTLKDAASIDWRAVRQGLGLGSDAAVAGLAANPAALRIVLAAQGTLRTLWTPEVTALNNEPALMRVATPGSSSLTLTVVPQISSDGIVQLSVSHSWEEHAEDRRTGILKTTPITRVADADTVARVVDGSTIVLTGILRPVEVAAAATGARALFGGQGKQPGYAELVVLIRPTIVTPGTFTATRH